MKPNTKLTIRKFLVVLCRVLVGATFIVSGWAKAIDPFGFVLKVAEYLSAWNLDAPNEVIIAGCVTMACLEFCIGISLVTGILRRLNTLTAAALMIFMLPLTFYIALTDPVDDCGCFGELWHISNWATFGKNIVLSAMIAYLLTSNRLVSSLYPAPMQWLAIVFSCAFPLFLALVGYHVQPIVDFRPYKIGTEIFASAIDDSIPTYYIYEKDGKSERFLLEALPDTTWTYLGVEGLENDNTFDGGIEVLNADDEDVTADIVSHDKQQLFLIISEPSMHYLSFVHKVSRLHEYCLQRDIEMIGVISATSSRLERWYDWCRPDFEVYTADPIALKQLVRGPEGLVFTENGIIRWKRTLSSMPFSEIYDEEQYELSELPSPDDGIMHATAAFFYVLAMFVLYLLSLSPRILKFFMRRNK